MLQSIEQISYNIQPGGTWSKTPHWGRQPCLCLFVAAKMLHGAYTGADKSNDTWHCTAFVKMQNKLSFDCLTCKSKIKLNCKSVCWCFNMVPPRFITLSSPPKDTLTMSCQEQKNKTTVIWPKTQQGWKYHRRQHEAENQYLCIEQLDCQLLSGAHTDLFLKWTKPGVREIKNVIDSSLSAEGHRQ